MEHTIDEAIEQEESNRDEYRSLLDIDHLDSNKYGR